MVKKGIADTPGEFGCNLGGEILGAKRKPVSEQAEQHHQKCHFNQKRPVFQPDSAVDDGLYNQGNAKFHGGLKKLKKRRKQGLLPVSLHITQQFSHVNGSVSQ